MKLAPDELEAWLETPESLRVGFIRHRAQEPANRITSRWRYSLMNWRHDSLK